MSPSNQTLQFDEFEHLFTEAELFSMQQTLESGALVKANQISKNSWNYSLRFDGNLTECEIKYNQKSVKQVLCACGFKGHSKLCKHSQLIIYWHILKIYRRAVKQAQTSGTKSEINFSQVSQEELVFYLKSLIRNNPRAKKNLAFLFKLGHINELDISPIADDTLQYINYLDEFHKNTITREKNALQAVNDIYFMSLRCFAISEVNRACSLMIASIEVLYIQIGKRKVINVQKYHLAIEKYIDALNQILTAIIAPQSLNFFLRYLLELTKRPYYYPVKKDLNLLMTIRNRIKHKTIEKELLGTIKSKCLQFVNHPFELIIWDIYYQIDPNSFLNFLKSATFGQCAAHSNILTYLGTRGKELNSVFYLDLFKWLLPKLNTDLKNLSANYLVEQDLPWADIQDKDFLLQLYISTKNIKLWKLYFMSSKPKSELMEYAKNYLTAKGINMESHPDILFDMLYESQEYQKLALELVKSGTIDQIMYYDPELPTEAKQILVKAYIAYLSDYRSNTIGPKATKRLRLISMHLLKHYENVVRGLKILQELA